MRDLWRGMAILAALGAMGLGILYFLKPPPLPNIASMVVVATAPGLPASPHAELMTALDRLNEAVASVPDQSPEQTLHRVSAPGHGCRLIWNGRTPSILFGRSPILPDSIATTLADCADAVYRLH
jgi:hypothetical protein